MATITITTAIPYVNAKPHLGFALELVQTDVIARYRRLSGDKVKFQTGTDENALKNVIAASERGVPVQELVDTNANLFKQLSALLNISYDEFLRTSEERHFKAVQTFWNQINPNDIYLSSYKGLYCAGCEDLVLERDLVDGCCPEHLKKPVEIEEKNYFFKLTAYQEKLEQLIESDTIHVIPETRKNEVLSFIRQGLQDISISRSSDRSGGWGIPVPGDSSQVVYVWIDALINYLSGLGFGTGGNWQEYWNSQSCKIHCIGKNVWKFHAIYWPALLLSAELPTPDTIVSHGFLLENGRKISKSLGSQIDAFDIIHEYGPEAIRYYLLRAISPSEDGDLSIEHLQRLYNTDLANDLGNLISRLTTLCAKAGYTPPQESLNQISDAPDGYHEALEQYDYVSALKSLWELLNAINFDIQQSEPWKLLKTGDLTQLHQQLQTWLLQTATLSYWLQPFLPGTAQAIKEAIHRDPIVPSGSLFPRLSLK